MDQNPELAKKITEDIVSRLERSKSPIPIGISNRHVHLDQRHWDTLFGKGAAPRKFRSVKQPGFWACYETVAIEGPKGRIDNVRLIAPHRPKTQIEISQTDAQQLGLRPPIRDSGKLEGSAPVRVIGPKGTLEIKEGLIIARRHIHFHPLEAQAMGIKDGEVVRVRAGLNGIRELVFEQVLCRVSDQFSLEFHIDTDEANAAWVKNGENVHIV
ncbi:MAG: phosphate propanoyltransferase [Elusimicrobia bacterium]|nr:phosphate propanoyltransferase [Elusimicrobiota bacterium]